ncbi:DUF3558 domain-containing protein [Actinoplanes sp. TRM 88003]|uniref:DUF3558 domain-containing protein n=1 Tax=Paractinoplanes aksuensis TaxID=2939490 RepID=A0ABT1DYF5_9ACTN|nr:DUF3558 domain-containing protein [Actinoplanes aksuensis]MCO8275843.1 DUF3558 domain-containing protein [Actinoplanes aksuensis]
MKRSPAAAAAVFLVGLTSGCGFLDQVVNRTPVPPESSAARSGFGSVRSEGEIPDPCTLLDRTEVAELTGRAVTQVDHDDAAPGDSTRFCQWQQTDGQLAVFLSRTTADDFDTAVAEAEPLGDAYWLNSHLYQLSGTVQIDVYTHGADEPENKVTAAKVAGTVLPRV